MGPAAVDAPPFDTQKAAAEVRDVGGFRQQQADAIVRVSVQATANLVTQKQMNAALDKQTADIRTEIQAAINSQTWRFVVAMIAISSTAVGVLVGLLNWLLPTVPAS